MLDNLTFSLLGQQEEDYKEFDAVYVEAFGIHPDLANMRPMVARDGSGKIVAFFGLYQVVVADSMWIAPEYRNKGLWKRLIEAINSLPWGSGRGYYFFEEKKKQGLIARMFGKELPIKVWRKVF